MNLQQLVSRDRLDRAGTIFSWICAFHCLILPLAVSAIPFAGASYLDNEFAEYGIIGVSILIGAATLFPAYFRDHRKLRSITIFIFGIGLIVLADQLFAESLAAKAGMVVIGAAAISAAHLLNRRLCRQCESCKAATGDRLL